MTPEETFEDLLKTIERGSKNNAITLKNVRQFCMSWRTEMQINIELSERQTPTEPSKDVDTKQLIIADVSKQRELLIAYEKWVGEFSTEEEWEDTVDKYLKESNL